MSKQTAVLALIVRGENVLLVSRKDDHNDFGLPGGKVEEGEPLLNALARELRDETGYDITPKECMLWAEEKGRPVITYLCEIAGGVEGTKEEGVIKWGTWQDAFDGRYGEYNRKVFNEYLLRNKDKANA